jgi:hypothetical protein
MIAFAGSVCLVLGAAVVLLVQRLQERERAHHALLADAAQLRQQGERLRDGLASRSRQVQQLERVTGLRLTPAPVELASSAALQAWWGDACIPLLSLRTTRVACVLGEDAIAEAGETTSDAEAAAVDTLGSLLVRLHPSWATHPDWWRVELDDDDGRWYALQRLASVGPPRWMAVASVGLPADPLAWARIHGLAGGALPEAPSLPSHPPKEWKLSALLEEGLSGVPLRAMGLWQGGRTLEAHGDIPSALAALGDRLQVPGLRWQGLRTLRIWHLSGVQTTVVLTEAGAPGTSLTLACTHAGQAADMDARLRRLAAAIRRVLPVEAPAAAPLPDPVVVPA